MGYSLGAAVTEWLAIEAERREVQQITIAHKTGISQSTISRAFNGRRVFSLDEAAAVCDALGVPLVAVIREAQQGRR